MKNVTLVVMERRGVVKNWNLVTGPNVRAKKTCANPREGDLIFPLFKPNMIASVFVWARRRKKTRVQK